MTASRDRPAERVVERVAQSPCEHCGHAIAQPGRGRLRRYCDRGCRQRAYELRTAQRRRIADAQAGRILPAPAERVVERTIEPRRPTTVDGWTRALQELGRQVAAGELKARRHAELRYQLRQVLAALDTDPEGPAAVPAPRVPPAPAPVPAVDGVTAALVRYLRQALAGTPAGAPGGQLSTTLGRLAAATGVDVDAARTALAGLHTGARVELYRDAGGRREPVQAERLAEHQRFVLAVVALD